MPVILYEFLKYVQVTFCHFLYMFFPGWFCQTWSLFWVGSPSWSVDKFGHSSGLVLSNLVAPTSPFMHDVRGISYTDQSQDSIHGQPELYCR